MEAIKDLVEEPLFIIIEIKVAKWGTYHCEFIFWEVHIT